MIIFIIITTIFIIIATLFLVIASFSPGNCDYIYICNRNCNLISHTGTLFLVIVTVFLMIANVYPTNMTSLNCDNYEK